MSTPWLRANAATIVAQICDTAAGWTDGGEWLSHLAPARLRDVADWDFPAYLTAHPLDRVACYVYGEPLVMLACLWDCTPLGAFDRLVAAWGFDPADPLHSDTAFDLYDAAMEADPASPERAALVAGLREILPALLAGTEVAA